MAQIAIDNAKRTFDVDLDKEIPRIKRNMDIDTNGLPEFWLVTKKDKRKCNSDKQRAQRQRESKAKIQSKVNHDLICPMNYLYGLNLKYERNNATTLSMDIFFIKHEMNEHKRKSKKVEALIEKYSLDLHNFYTNHSDINWEEDKNDLILLRSDFEELIKDIQSIYISGNYKGMMSWLINRAFCINAGVKRNKNIMNSSLDKNKALLMKVLYNVNKDAFLACFTQDIVDT